ncbi:hypothetical protein N1851_026541 [Merluccius polli]|uniref:Uncharacterized protein n=1 Tax=Merluccius polli TaxID=89951 RepID=A0AA47NTY5_MERPO|nr:hypothetical protein N1851_026541 [Merluccius polli]
MARSCRVALSNNPALLMREAAQLLVQVFAISHLDYCNSLLAGLPASNLCSVSRLRQHDPCSTYRSSPI